MTNLQLQQAAEQIGHLTGIEPRDVYASIGANTIHWEADHET